MKKNLLLVLTVVVCFCGYKASAQTELTPDQNPNYAVSRVKYMQVADSLNEWHSTTQHNIYKAIDWLADRKEARADRREFRRQLRMERARWDYNYYNDGYYSGNYYHGNFNHRNRYNHYRRNRSFGISPWYGLNFWWR
jgi:hypothetical protein